MPEAMRHPDLPPPVTTVGLLGWIRQNLFSSPLQIFLTCVMIALLYTLLAPFVKWALVDANWSGESREDCTQAGACWVFIKVRLGQFIYGFYPRAERWRVDTTFVLLILASLPLFVPSFTKKVWAGVFLFILYPFIAYTLLVGGVTGLPLVETQLWGGLMLTLVVAGIGIATSLPIGIVLALGRRSAMPVVRAICVAFIEVVRGVPLITILFMASVMFPMFLPQGVNFDKLLRALIGVSLFASAYMAEVVRGGLQGIPRGQYEAAASMGLGYWKMMGLVILPQALRIVIPGIVNTFIALFKDTTLVLIIGLFDLLGIIQAASTDPRWLGYAMEGYVFAGFVFWIFCFSMSRFSMALEKKLGAGERSGWAM